MLCVVKLFAVARERIGRDSISVELPAGSTVANLRAELAQQFPQLAPLLAQVRFAVNSEFSRETTPLTADSEIAIIPPVSGG